MLTALILAAALQATPPPVDCADADHAAFDFWIGDWVVSPSNQPDTDVATSRIESVAGGCAIQETYHQTLSRDGEPVDYHGRSYSAFDASDGRWKQFYVDSAGWVASFVGEALDGGIVMVA